ncbi:hypothetical protein QP938_05540 [Porticoccaceae bacterium LTM1]|nr:hypothetical protein QP938_05540 [Porticoccaceae bacterium LTM1]
MRVAGPCALFLILVSIYGYYFFSIGVSDLAAVSWSLSYFVGSLLLFLSYIDKNKILFLINNVLWFKFCYVPAVILENNPDFASFGIDVSAGYFCASLYAMACMVSLNFAFYFVSRYLCAVDKNRLFYNNIVHGQDFKWGLFGLAFFVFISSVLYKVGNPVEVFSHRLIENQGKGFLQIGGFIGYGLSFFFVYKYLLTKRKRFLLSGFLVAAVGGGYFALLGYRGGALYSLIIFIVLIFFSADKRWGFAVFLPLFFLLINEVNWVTGAVRMIVSGYEGSFSELYAWYKSQYLIPLAFNHYELVSYLFESRGLQELFFGGWETVWSSYTNWIPRSLVPDKGLTSGPMIGLEVLPDIVTSEGRTSSLTTGVVFESIYNFGAVGGLIFVFLFYSLFSYFLRAFKVDSFPRMYLYVLCSWVFGFSIYFDDLGGAINKVVLILVGYFILLALSKVLKRVSFG